MDVLHVISELAIQFSGFVGAVIALVGTLYMAYDLFGQRHGPLRIFTEAITYIIIGVVLGSMALGVIALDAIAIDPYFVPSVTAQGAVSVLLAFGASGGFGAGLGYILTIERKWNAGHPKYRKDRPVRRVLVGLALGLFEGCLVYAVMANFRNTYDIRSGVFWGCVQGPPAGLLFGFLVAFFQTRFNQPVSTTNGDTLLEPMANSAGQGSGHKQAFDIVGLLSGIATGIAVGPMTATSYFALYGPFVPITFITISIAGIIGGTGLGLVLATAERILLWIDRLPPKRLGIAGAFFVVLGFLFQAIQQLSQININFLTK